MAITHTPKPTMIDETGSCGQNCMVCYRTTLQLKWIITAACFVITGIVGMAATIEVNRRDVAALSNATAATQGRLEYVVIGVNDIKNALGLEIRMPAKLEALKQ